MTIAIDHRSFASATGRAMPYGGAPDACVDADTLVRTHIHCVEKIARIVYSRTSTALPVEDLVQIGLVALIEAASAFEMRGVARFFTYASQRVRGAMIDELRHNATMSRRALRDRRTFTATSARLAGSLGRQPTSAEMAAALGISVSAYDKAVATARSTHYQSIDATYSDSSGWFADPAPDPCVRLEQQRLQAAVHDTIASLPAREAQVLQLFFFEERELEDIGCMMGITGARVCQLKKRALEKVRERLADWS